MSTDNKELETVASEAETEEDAPKKKKFLHYINPYMSSIQ